MPKIGKNQDIICSEILMASSGPISGAGKENSSSSSSLPDAHTPRQPEAPTGSQTSPHPSGQPDVSSAVEPSPPLLVNFAEVLKRNVYKSVLMHKRFGVPFISKSIPADLMIPAAPPLGNGNSINFFRTEYFQKIIFVRFKICL